ncbi:MAG: APC family permease [Bdellovibrionota bacterium]
MRATCRKNPSKPLGKIELIAIALGGMVGGGIFSILGISVDIIGYATPIAIFLGGGLAYLAAFSYAKLTVYYKDEGATYSFFKRTYPQNRFAIFSIGWLITFGYVSTLALYAYTFATYFTTLIPTVHAAAMQKTISFCILFIFVLINSYSVKGMGKIEDAMVYIKIILLLFISGYFISYGDVQFIETFLHESHPLHHVFIVAAITFVAYEGFQLAIHAYHEVDDPDRSIVFAIHWAIICATLVYVVLAVGALMVIPKDVLIRDQEYALAAGATKFMGIAGYIAVMAGALLATSSAINGTLFGASRLISVIAADGVFPRFLSKQNHHHIPQNAISCMGLLAFIFVLTGELETIIEFGSITFIVVSFLMAMINYKLHTKTGTHPWIALSAMIMLGLSCLAILYYELTQNVHQMLYIGGVYALLIGLAKIFSRKHT